MFVFKAAVVGAGVVGGEIAQVIAAAGIPVLLKDVDPRFVEQGLEQARDDLVTGTTSYEAFGDVDLVVEAVPERIEIKHAVFAELDAATPGHAVLASNTSGLSITEIGDATSRPDKVVGLHFFAPASRTRLVEVVEGEETSGETMQTAANFAQAIRKTPVRCAECPGFVVNRILAAAASEVWRYQDESGIDPEALDEHVARAAGMPTGPFRAAEESGLDAVVKLARDMRDAYGDRFYVHRGMERRVDGR